jgi:hypothetical protein
MIFKAKKVNYKELRFPKDLQKFTKDLRFTKGGHMLAT